MTLEKLLLEKLAKWRPLAADPTLTLNHPDSGLGLTLTADVVDTLACRLREVRIQRATAPAQDLKTQAETLATKVTGLLEPLTLLEVDNLALLRSKTPARDGDDVQYYELVRHPDGATVLRRYQARRDSSNRHMVPFALTHEVLAKLVRDLSA